MLIACTGVWESAGKLYLLVLMHWVVFMFETLGLIQSVRTLCSYHSWGPYDEPHGLLDAVCLDRVIMHSFSRVPGRYMAKAEK